MVNFVSGPIVAVMGTAEGVIVKARELIESAFSRDEVVEAEDDDGRDGEALALVSEDHDAEAGGDRRNGQLQTED